MPPGNPDTFHILFVCTGNICRSPFAEFLTGHLLSQRLGTERAARFTAASAGTRAVVGARMDPATMAELAPWGLDAAAADGFLARQLDAADVRRADLVLTAERRHRTYVVGLTPSALPRTFCLRELDRLLAVVATDGMPTDPVALAKAVVAAASRARGLVAYASSENDSVPDPIGQPPAAHHVTARMIASSVTRFVGTLASTLDSGIAPTRGPNNHGGAAITRQDTNM